MTNEQKQEIKDIIGTLEMVQAQISKVQEHVNHGSEYDQLMMAFGSANETQEYLKNIVEE